MMKYIIYLFILRDRGWDVGDFEEAWGETCSMSLKK